MDKKFNSTARWLIPAFGLALVAVGGHALMQRPDPIAILTGRTPTIEPARLIGRWTAEETRACSGNSNWVEYAADGSVRFPDRTGRWELEGDMLGTPEPTEAELAAMRAVALARFRSNPQFDDSSNGAGPIGAATPEEMADAVVAAGLAAAAMDAQIVELTANTLKLDLGSRLWGDAVTFHRCTRGSQ
ncbi:MAG: hypothetical protein MUF14_07130 [Hyphomonadaceae bacterium]|nr:hypothetical protein [Hyphomonadaceae bacterium]